MTVFLVPLGQGRTIPIDKAVLLFGRHPDCDVVLTNSRKVSRKHCCLAVVNNKLFIRDLGSMNGVRVNGEKVRNLAPLKVGDELAVGDVYYKLLPDKSLPTAKPSAPGTSQGSKPVNVVRQPVVRSPLPDDISQSRPIVLPEPASGEDSFVIEASQMNTPASPKKVADWEFDGIPSDDEEPVSLEDSEYDIKLADESSDNISPQKFKSPPAQPPTRKPVDDDNESDVIMLDEESGSDDIIILD